MKLFIWVTIRRHSRKEWAVTSSISYAFSKMDKKSDSFAVLYGQHFNATMSFTGLRKYMHFKEIKQLHLIGAMEPLVYLNAIYVYRNS